MWQLFWTNLLSVTPSGFTCSFSTMTVPKWTCPTGPVSDVQHRGQGTPGSCHIPIVCPDGQKQDVPSLSPLNSLGVTAQSFQQGCCVNYKYPQDSVAFGQGLSESHTVLSLFGILWPRILKESRSCPRQPPHLTHGEDTETRKAHHKVPQYHVEFTEKNIFSALTSNTALKTRGKDVCRKLRGVSNTAHTLVLLWHPFPPCQKHLAPLLSCQIFAC